MADLELSEEDEAMLAGEYGEAAKLCLRMVIALAQVRGATRLLTVESAHVDGCLYHGQAGLDFVERLGALGGRAAVPTTLNVGSLDLRHPDLVHADAETTANARRLMAGYTALGCKPTWTCAPYQLTHRPSFGTHVAWAESNAIVFANSVLGARTDRYGDFLDIGAAITGRVPDAGLHRDVHRRATIRFDCAGLSRRLLGEDAAWGVLGHLAGRLAGSGVPVLTGVPATVPEDQLKAFGAAAASSGGVGLFHVVGVTPEAPELAAVASPDLVTHVVDADQVRAVRDELTTAHGPDLDALCLGTPHFSLTEFERLAGLLADGGPFHPGVSAYVTTSRAVLAEADRLGYAETVRSAGARIVVDTCTYITPILDAGVRTAMTNSGKWAWYAPGNIGVDVALGSLAECVASARAGRIVREEALWAS
ncbi:aconitase X catalytic domain-containing protein [Amycolatopsis sp. NPDC023774]|uniref:aconitase X catalytic domain-containing protein n=1 Tax=Amycolatopsis sp. NPDC023774 TaxID=3155015 RepID=UPI00340D611A